MRYRQQIYDVPLLAIMCIYIYIYYEYHIPISFIYMERCKASHRAYLRSSQRDLPIINHDHVRLGCAAWVFNHGYEPKVAYKPWLSKVITTS